MKTQIKFVNGVKIAPRHIFSEQMNIDGSLRNVLIFKFHPDDFSLDLLKSLFTENNCNEIIIIDNGIEYTHTGYCVRVKFDIENEKEEREDGEFYNIEYVKIIMAKRTYLEAKTIALENELNDLKSMVLDLMNNK